MSPMMPTDEITRRHDLDVHHRLEDLDAALLNTLAHRRAGGDFEGDGRRVDFVERAVVQRHEIFKPGDRVQAYLSKSRSAPVGRSFT